MADELEVCSTPELLKDDRISDLPDDILVHVLSLLTLKEAGLTSVLSKRWRHVWAYIPTLDFYDRNIRDEFDLETKSWIIEKPKYLYWVDQVVSSYKAPTLDKFRMVFDIVGDSNAIINSWVRFSMEKRVKSLELNFSRLNSACTSGIYTSYPFPSFFSCNSLTSLVLDEVEISGDLLESLLCHSPALEYLSVTRSKSLEELTVSGSSLNLKHLRIDGFLKRLEISTPNLVSVCYRGPKYIKGDSEKLIRATLRTTPKNISVVYKRLPKLAEVSLGGPYGMDFRHSFSDLGCHVSQIEVLKLSTFMIREVIEPVKYPLFQRLKKLVIHAGPADTDGDLFVFVPLIKACPCLHHLKLEFRSYEDFCTREQLRKHEVYPLNHLKIVEIVGFIGISADLEFVEYLFESAVSLDKVIADTHTVLEKPICTYIEEKRRAMKRAEGLRRSLEPRTKLIIL